MLCSSSSSSRTKQPSNQPCLASRLSPLSAQVLKQLDNDDANDSDDDNNTLRPLPSASVPLLRYSAMTTPARPGSSHHNHAHNYNHNHLDASANPNATTAAATVSARSPSSPTRFDNPRPSISPLSAKASPSAIREHAVQPDPAATATSRNHDDDDGSSILSEPEDELDAQAQQSQPDHVLATSEELAAHQSLEVDSEAETERLDQTPHKNRIQIGETGKTPSKLIQAATLEDELSDPPSPLPTGLGATSSTSTTDTLGKYNCDNLELCRIIKY